MSSQITIGYIAGFFEGIGALPYLYSMIRKRTKPSRTTWFIWSGVSIILFLTYYLSGARETLWQPGIAVLFNLLFAILSLKYGVGGTNRLDIFCFVGAIISLVLWAFTKNPVVGMTIIVIIAIIGSIPTIIKVSKHPESEDKITWLCWSLGAILNLFAIKSWTYEIAFYPIQAAVILSLIFLLLLRQLINNTNKRI
jgi:hypothetical protein